MVLACITSLINSCRALKEPNGLPWSPAGISDPAVGLEYSRRYLDQLANMAEQQYPFYPALNGSVQHLAHEVAGLYHCVIRGP